jgi:hypothetical protein
MRKLLSLAAGLIVAFSTTQAMAVNDGRSTPDPAKESQVLMCGTKESMMTADYWSFDRPDSFNVGDLKKIGCVLMSPNNLVYLSLRCRQVDTEIKLGHEPWRRCHQMLQSGEVADYWESTGRYPRK